MVKLKYMLRLFDSLAKRQVAVGQRDKLSVFSNDYPTVDGTGVRGYLHMVDLVEGHVAALDYLHQQDSVLLNVNLGCGEGVSVLGMITAFEQASAQPISYEFVGRRAGDVAHYWGDPTLANKLFGWSAKCGVDEMCADTWRWQSGNPKGYDSK